MAQARGQAGGTAAAAVRSEIVLQPPPPVFFNINPIRLGREQGGAALQEKELFDVVAARLQWSAPSLRSLLELMWPGIAIALQLGTRATAASRPEAPDRSGGDFLDTGFKIV